MWIIFSAGCWACNDWNECLLQDGRFKTIESSASGPLRCHSVHISEAGIVVSSCVGPLRVVLCFVPGGSAWEFDGLHISDSIGSTPRILQRSAPGFGQNRWFQHIVESIFEDTGIDSTIFEDKQHVGSIDGVVLVGEGAGVVWLLDSASSH